MGVIPIFCAVTYFYDWIQICFNTDEYHPLVFKMEILKYIYIYTVLKVGQYGPAWHTNKNSVPVRSTEKRGEQLAAKIIYSANRHNYIFNIHEF